VELDNKLLPTCCNLCSWQRGLEVSLQQQPAPEAQLWSSLQQKRTKIPQYPNNPTQQWVTLTQQRQPKTVKYMPTTTEYFVLVYACTQRCKTLEQVPHPPSVCKECHKIHERGRGQAVPASSTYVGLVGAWVGAGWRGAVQCVGGLCVCCVSTKKRPKRQYDALWVKREHAQPHYWLGTTGVRR